MAERSTAAVGVANEGGQPPLSAQADSATADDSNDRGGERDQTSERKFPGATVPAEDAGSTDDAEPGGADAGSNGKPSAISRTSRSSDDGEGPTDLLPAVDGDQTAPTPADARGATSTAAPGTAGGSAPDPAGPPELHSGHMLAKRYRLEECVTRVDGFSGWRAVDEKLRRAVGIYVLPSAHPRSRAVLAAARSAALLGDPRFVQVLDAVEENDLVYVIHEWLPDATDLAAVLAARPLAPHDAYQMVLQVSQAMAAAHREGLAHLRLTPACVLRTESGQYRIRGLAVEAALHGVRSERPQHDDTETIGAVLYAALTQRWPCRDGASGLVALPEDVGLVAPDRVRAGVHRGLSELAMRALVQDGSRADAFPTPEELAKGVAAIPKIKPPEPVFQQPAPYRPPTTREGRLPPNAPTATLPTSSPPTRPGRTGKVLKWSVSALVIAALGFGSWQLANTLLHRGTSSEANAATHQQSGSSGNDTTAARILAIKDGVEYYPFGGAQHPGQVRYSYDNKPSTFWRTNSFKDGPDFAPSIKKGVGIVYDLGTERKVGRATINLYYGGSYTAVSLYSADSLSSSTPFAELTKLTSTKTTGKSASLTLGKPVTSRYLVVWLTALPYSSGDGYYGPGYKQAITDVTFEGE